VKLHGLQNEKKALIHDAEQANLRLVALEGELEERNRAVEKAGEDLAGVGVRIEQLCTEKDEVARQVKLNSLIARTLLSAFHAGKTVKHGSFFFVALNFSCKKLFVKQRSHPKN
jgi:hypothetical protein